jgi:hypothetical protein
MGATLAASLAGAATAIGGRGADSAFLYRQRHPLQVQAPEVERLVRTAPDPLMGKGPPGIAATCRPHGQRGLRNPWSCAVRYRSGRQAGIRVELRDDGSYTGRYRGGGQAQGCCIPAARRD